MSDRKKTKAQLMEELAQLRQQVTELGNAEGRFRELFEDAPTAYVSIGTDGHIQQVNRQAEELTGRARDDLIGSPVFELYADTPAGKEKAHEAFDRFVAGEEIRGEEVEMRRADGASIWISLTVRPILDAAGQVVASRSMLMDITAHKRVDETLLQERNFAESLVETAQAIVLVLDRQGRIVRFNPYMEEISGYRLEEVQGKDWFTTFLPPRDRARIRRLFPKAVGGIQTRGNVNPILTKDGEEREIEWYDKTLKDATGHVFGLLTIGQDVTARRRMEEALRQAHDELEQQVENRTAELQAANEHLRQEITERQQAEESLRDSETQYRIVADNTYDWEFWLSLEGRFLYCSPSCDRITGYAAHEFETDPALLLRIMHPEDRARFTAHRHGDKCTPPSEGLVFRIIQRDGETRWIEHLFQPVHDADGHYLGDRGSNRDITARKQVEQALEKQQVRAMQADRLQALGEMAAGVAHELNQPLTAISTTAEGIYLRLEEGLEITPERMKEMMGDVLRLVDRASDTIEHLRVFSRDSSSQPVTRFSLNEVIHSSLQMIGSQLKEHSIELQLDLAEELPPLSGHPTQIEQVLLNLLANARDALDTKGEEGRAGDPWEARLHLRTWSETDGGVWVVTEVEDNGTGLDEADRKRIFEPFFTTKDAAQGTGLGLSISYGIVQQHGGQIACTSRRGEGATFQVRLPAAAAEV